MSGDLTRWPIGTLSVHMRQQMPTGRCLRHRQKQGEDQQPRQAALYEGV